MRKTPQPQPITVYLRKERREDQLNKLKALATEHAGGKISVLVQMIALGELEVHPTNKQTA